jgi:hypothetical protein
MHVPIMRFERMVAQQVPFRIEQGLEKRPGFFGEFLASLRRLEIHVHEAWLGEARLFAQ